MFVKDAHCVIITVHLRCVPFPVPTVAAIMQPHAAVYLVTCNGFIYWSTIRLLLNMQ